MTSKYYVVLKDQIVDNVTTIDTDKPLSANQGKLLNDRINNLETSGRFLSLWNCATGLATTNPPSTPYTYNTGDYFIITVVDTTTNYMPNGTQYTGTASTTTTSENVQKGDIWRYDGSVWSFEQNHSAQDGVLDVQINSTSIVSAGTANITVDTAVTSASTNPVQSGAVKTAIDTKVRSGTGTLPLSANIGDIFIKYSA